jgi:hypothetical protein
MMMKAGELIALLQKASPDAYVSVAGEYDITVTLDSGEVDISYSDN